MKRIFKWLIGLFIAAVLLVVVGVIVLLMSYNSILRVALEHQIREQTGMDVEIGGLKVGLIAATAEIRNLKIHNSKEFGGAPFLDIPEIRVEYDRAALARHEIHLTLLRFNLGELDIVKNSTGDMNLAQFGLTNQISALAKAIPSDGPAPAGSSSNQLAGFKKKSGDGGTVQANTNIFLPGTNSPVQNSGGGSNALADFKKQSGYDFTGIDRLNVSIGKVKYVDQSNPQNNREQTIGIEDLDIPNVKSTTDLLGLAADIALRSNGFFDFLVDPKVLGLAP